MDPVTQTVLGIRRHTVRYFVEGRRYIILLHYNQQSGVLEFVADVESLAWALDQERVAAVQTALEEIEAERGKVEAWIEHLTTLTEAEHSALISLAGKEWGPPDAWRQWWEETGKRKFTLMANWRVTLQKLKQSLPK